MPGPDRTNKYIAQVEDDVRVELLTNAGDLLMKKDYEEVIPSDTTLEAILRKLAMAHFKTVYGYEFNDLGSVINPPASLGTNHPTHNLCSIIPPLGSQIADYLEKSVFESLQLPSWMAEVAKSDLSNIAYDVLQKDTQKQWRTREYTRSYDAQIEDRESYQCDSVLVYCNGSLLEDGSTANLCVIYFVGVYYTVTTESKKTRDLIQAEAYRNAATQIGIPTIPRIPMFQEMLKEALDIYTQQRFENEFGYKYDDHPPTSLCALGVTGAILSHNSHVCYIPDFKVEHLKNYISDKQIFKGINLDMPSIKASAIDSIVGVYESVLKNAAINTWTTTRIDHTYTHSNPLLNPIRQSGIVMSWYGHKTTQQGVTISVTYIYFNTIVYEEQNARQELMRELFKQLCNGLCVHLKDPTAAKTLDALPMKDYLFSYAKEKWNQVFEFEFKGLQTEPLDKKPGKAVQAFDKLFFLDEYPASLETIENFMNTELFKRGDTRFPAYMRSDLYDDLRDHILHYASENTPKDANIWYKAEHTHEFVDPKETKLDLKHYALFVYALGDMAPNGMDGDKEGVHMQRLFVYYLGVVSSFVP